MQQKRSCYNCSPYFTSSDRYIITVVENKLPLTNNAYIYSMPVYALSNTAIVLRFLMIRNVVCYDESKENDLLLKNMFKRVVHYIASNKKY